MKRIISHDIVTQYTREHNYKESLLTGSIILAFLKHMIQLAGGHFLLLDVASSSPEYAPSVSEVLTEE